MVEISAYWWIVFRPRAGNPRAAPLSFRRPSPSTLAASCDRRFQTTARVVPARGVFFYVVAVTPAAVVRLKYYYNRCHHHHRRRCLEDCVQTARGYVENLELQINRIDNFDLD